MRIDRLKIFLDSMGGGAWPFLVGGVICLVDSDNGRDPSVLVGRRQHLLVGVLLDGLSSFQTVEV